MNRNDLMITEAIWCQFPAELRKDLRRILRRKSVVINHRVLDIAQALCECGAYSLAYDFYLVLDGQLLIPHQGCEFGLMMNPKDLMGERGPDPSGTILA